jgi:hypothetical protein
VFSVGYRLNLYIAFRLLFTLEELSDVCHAIFLFWLMGMNVLNEKFGKGLTCNVIVLRNQKKKIF